MQRVSKTAVWVGVLVGSTVGGFVPALWGAGMFSWWGVIGTAVGGILGILVAVKLG